MKSQGLQLLRAFPCSQNLRSVEYGNTLLVFIILLGALAQEEESNTAAEDGNVRSDAEDDAGRGDFCERVRDRDGTAGPTHSTRAGVAVIAGGGRIHAGNSGRRRVVERIGFSERHDSTLRQTLQSHVLTGVHVERDRLSLSLGNRNRSALSALVADFDPIKDNAVFVGHRGNREREAEVLRRGSAGTADLFCGRHIVRRESTGLRGILGIIVVEPVDLFYR